MDINTCTYLDSSYRTIAYYSHLIPVFITVVLAVFALLRTRFSLLSKIFACFAFCFCFWLIGDVFLWTSGNYNLITFFWAPLDYLNVLFYLFGFYFFIVLIHGRDTKLWFKAALFAVSLPAWYITATNKSILFFNQAVCEAGNSAFLTEYKLVLEIAVVVGIIVLAIVSYRGLDAVRRKQVRTVALALILFFSVFSATEYISSVTGIYQINLYSLFILPVFLGLIIYAVTNFEVFQLRFLGTQLVAYVLVILVGSQFFFLENTTDKTLTVLTFFIALAFCYFLIQGIVRENKQREQIEALAKNLQVANDGQANLIHIINHQIKGYLSKGRIVLSELLTNPVYTSALSPDGKKLTEQGFEFLTEGTDFIQGVLHASSIEAGVMRYEKQLFDLKAMIREMVEKNKKAAEAKGLTITTALPETYCMYNGDERLLREVVGNLIDNAVKYSLQGTIMATLAANAAAYTISIHDTGVGITDEDKKKLFTRGGRGKNSSKINVDSTGYGLYFAKNVVQAHGGTIAANSEGENKGSTFTVTLPIENSSEAIAK